MLLQRLAGFVGRHPDKKPRQRLADTNLARFARRSAERNNILYHFGRFPKCSILPCIRRFGPLAHVHADGSVWLPRTHEILVHRLGEKRHERRDQTLQCVQTLVQRQVGRLFVGARFAFPESAPIAPDIPVTELVDEGLYRLSGTARIVGIHRLRDGVDGVMGQGQCPAVNLRTIRERDVVIEVDLIKGGVQGEKPVGVPQRVDERARHLTHDINGDSFLALRCQSGKKIPSQRIRADMIKDVVGVDDVANRLGHLLAVLVHNMAQADTVAVSHAVRDECGNRMQAVEPAAGLVDCLADVVGREVLSEGLLVFEGIVPLGI